MTAPAPLPPAEAIRSLPRHLHREHWDDRPAKISHAMGHREFFQDIDASAVHRIGLNAGLGWRIPGIRPDGIDYVLVMAGKSSGLFDIQLLHCGDRPPGEAELVNRTNDLTYAELRPAYDRMMT